MTYPTSGSPAPAPSAPPPVGRARAPLTPVCLAIIGICAVALGAQYLLGIRLDRAGLLYGPAVAHGEWWRVLTNILLHGGVLHLFFNMSVVWTLGRVLESHLGSLRFLVVSLVTALGASSSVLLFNFTQPTLGASGMIIGWAGVILPIATPQGRQGLRTWLIQIAVISLLPGVSWAGHLGGFVWGLPCGWALRGGPARFRWAAPLLVALSAGACWAAVAMRLPPAP